MDKSIFLCQHVKTDVFGVYLVYKVEPNLIQRKLRLWVKVLGVDLGGIVSLVVYFDQLLGAARNQKLVELLFSGIDEKGYFYVMIATLW